MENTSNAILYVCSQCRKQSTVTKRLYEHEFKYEHTCKERLASVCMLDDARETEESYGTALNGVVL